MTTTTSNPQPTVHRSLGELAASSRAAIETFDRVGLDYCCRGELTLSEAAQRAGVRPEVVAQSLGAGNEEPAPEIHMTTQGLIEHITREFHERHRSDLPELIDLARRVETVHQFDADTPHGLSEVLVKLQSKLVADMAEEERHLFPAIRGEDPTAARQIVQRLQAERQHYADHIHAIEDVANGFDLPPAACRSWQRLYFGTARLVDELRYHVHLENNILFPRLLAEAAE